MSKMSKNHSFFKNLQELQKKNAKKKSLFSKIRNTQCDQSSPVQPNPEKNNVDKPQQILKNIFFF